MARPFTRLLAAVRQAAGIVLKSLRDKEDSPPVILGHVHFREYLQRVTGLVTGSIVTDAKQRQYSQQYRFTEEKSGLIRVQRSDGYGDSVLLPATLELDEGLVAFFGLYSGDGSKGSEDPNDSTRIVPQISFSQKEKHLVRFAVDQFRRVFPGTIRFTFSLGEDSALFLDGDAKSRLDAFYRATTDAGTPPPQPLSNIRPTLNAGDLRYLGEVRPDVLGINHDHLAFYYLNKDAMQSVLAEEKRQDLASVGIKEAHDLKVTASLRRPFKKGARFPGGSSRSDELHVGGINGLGELFLKVMHEIEDTTLRDTKVSASGLVEWLDTPSKLGQQLDLASFFTTNPYGQLNGARPVALNAAATTITAQWRQSTETTLHRFLKLDPLWCYVAGLYLAEGSTPKEQLFSMFTSRPQHLAIGFTSSEGTSIELVLRTLQKLFPKDACLDAWKVKVGSQYFPELVVTGLKHGVPMLRGGASGDGKLRTMEISIAVKEWALSVADTPIVEGQSLLHRDYADRYSHVEPTGAGVARIDFWASSTLARWYFPILMYTVFSGIAADPTKAFYA